MSNEGKSKMVRTVIIVLIAAAAVAAILWALNNMESAGEISGGH
jgi:heme/copper-type cytochrome/quinol oxidase subunit 4